MIYKPNEMITAVSFGSLSSCSTYGAIEDFCDDSFFLLGDDPCKHGYI